MEFPLLLALSNFYDHKCTVDNEMIRFPPDMRNWRKKLLYYKEFDASSNKAHINDVDKSLDTDGIRVKNLIYTHTEGFAIFFANRDVTEQDMAEEEKILIIDQPILGVVVGVGQELLYV